MTKQTRVKPYDLVALNTNHPSGDAFGRLRISTPDTIFDNKLLYGKGTGTYWSEELNGDGASTHDPDESCVDLEVTSNGDFAIRQTKQRINYQAGKSQLFYLTGIIGFGTGLESRIGSFHGGTTTPFNAFDGVCFESINGVVSCSIYKGGVKTQTAAQSAWNQDLMNGMGLSGVTVDWTKAQIFIIDYEWLGVGRVRFGLNIDGVTYYVHEFYNANIVSNVYMRSGSQPIRYELRSTGGSGTMKQICCSAQSEGGFNPKGLQASVGTGNTAISIGDEWELLHAIRLKEDQLDATVLVEHLSTIAVSSGDYEYGLFWNPVIAGTLTWTDLQGSAIQEALGDGSTHDITPIITMWSGYNSSDTDAQNVDIKTSLRLGSNVDGARDVIALGCRTFSSTDTFAGNMILRQVT